MRAKSSREAFDNAVADVLIEEFGLKNRIDPAKVKTMSAQEKLKYVCDLATDDNKNTKIESAVINSFDYLYDYFANENSIEDAKNILIHKIYYEQGKHIPIYSPGKFKYDSVRDQDKTGRFENGHMTIEKYEEATMGQNLLETGIQSFVGTITRFGWLGILETIGEKTNSPAYYEYNPGAILKQGDMEVYYSSGSSGGYGKYYYYREDELLYIATDGKSLYEKGENFDKYTNEKKQSVEGTIEDGASIIYDMLFD